MGKNYFDLIFDQLCQRLKDHDSLQSVSRDFMKLTTDRERVGFLVKIDAVWDTIRLPTNHQKIVADSRKLPEKSRQLREEGNRVFRAKQYGKALQKYTESLAHAPPAVEQLEAGFSSENSATLAVANRSAVLFHEGKYEPCLEDIDRAVSYGYLKTLVYKLHDRRGQCLVSLGKQTEAEAAFALAKSALETSELDENKRAQWRLEIDKRTVQCKNIGNNNSESLSNSVAVSCNRNLPQLGSSNDTYLSLSDKCDVTFTADQGRFIVAKQEVVPGDVILVERPYASILLSDNHLDHCDHCCKHSVAPVPCRTCSYSLYCSENCREAAFDSYHRWECTINPLLRYSGVDKFAILAVHALIVTGLSGIQKHIEQLNSGKVEVNNNGCDKDGIYRAESYDAIVSLVTHAEHRTAHDLFRRASIAIFLLRCICSSGFFQTEKPADDVLSVAGGLLLSHLQSFPCNAHEIAEFDLDVNAVATSVPYELGAGIYATLSLFNHSCNPAVTRNFYGDICVVRAIRSVNPGEELSDNYGAVYAMQPRDERRHKLQPQYFFECQCEACFNDWPLFSAVRNVAPRWRCGNCKSVLPSNFNCPSCSQKQTLGAYMQQLSDSDKRFKVAFDHLLQCDVDGALPDMLRHLRTMDELLCLPWEDYGACQEAVKQCFSIMANCRLRTRKN